jgi:hypothetical protein
MRAWITAVFLVLAAGTAFAIGRSTAPDALRPTDPGRQDIVVRLGDEIRVPAVGLFCTAYFEIDRANFLCNRTDDRARYQVVFERFSTSVGRLGYPGNQRVFPERP